MMKKPTVYWPLIMAVLLVLIASKSGVDLFLLWAALFFLPLGYLVGLLAQRRLSRKKPGAYSAPSQVLIQSIVCLGLMAGAFVGGYCEDVARDQATLVEVTKESPLFKDTTRTEKLGMVMPNDSLSVLRIRNLREGVAIQVRRQDGTEGWIFTSPYVKTKSP